MELPDSLQETGALPQVGQWYALLADYGAGTGMITSVYQYTSPAGEEYPELLRQLYVLAVLEPATSGVGYSSEETVLCMWLDPARVGRIRVHHISFPMGDFAALVGAGSEPPEYADYLAQQSSPTAGA